jgi:hypothetical protein
MTHHNTRDTDNSDYRIEYGVCSELSSHSYGRGEAVLEGGMKFRKGWRAHNPGNRENVLGDGA